MMPCHTRKKHLEVGFLWLLLTVEFGFMVTSLEPGFLDFDNLPDTNFSCVGKVIGGYYADLETSCQMFHVCTIGQLDEPMDIRFRCLNGTVFDQETRVCERIDEVDCSKSEQFYSLNLELYGNTQPSILDESPETEAPQADSVKKSTTTTTTTTIRPTAPTTPRPNFIITTTSVKPRVVNVPHATPQNQQPPANIRFNPADFKISLHHGAPLNPTPISFQAFGGNQQRVIVTTHTVAQRKPTSAAINREKEREYEEEEEEEEVEEAEDSTEDSDSYGKFGYKPSTFRTSLFQPATSHPGPTTYRNAYQFQRSGPAQSAELRRLQQLPSLSPLTFSSPAPFSLLRHVETKRFVDAQRAPPPPQQQVQPSNRKPVHHKPPRIVISASASVSDATGRKFNYSLGTIGDSRLFGTAPQSYDDYKEEDVSSDPFYRDVPKLATHRRQRRQAVPGADEFEAERDAIEVLRFLFNWYASHEKVAATRGAAMDIPIPAETITEINDELTPKTAFAPPDDEEVDGTEKEYPRTRYPRPYLSLQLLKAVEGEPQETENHGAVRYDEVLKRTSNEEVLKPTTLPSSDYVDDNYEGVPLGLEPAAPGNGNYSSLPEYIDDNYEPLVYKHKDNGEQSQIAAPHLHLLPPKSDTAAEMTEMQKNYEVPLYSKPVPDTPQGFATETTTTTTTTTPLTPTTKVPTYIETELVGEHLTTETHQTLSNFGFTINRPTAKAKEVVTDQRRGSSKPKVNRGRTRFSFDDLAIPPDVIRKAERSSKSREYQLTTQAPASISGPRESTRRVGEEIQDIQEFVKAATTESLSGNPETTIATEQFYSPEEVITTLFPDTEIVELPNSTLSDIQKTTTQPEFTTETELAGDTTTVLVPTTTWPIAPEIDVVSTQPSLDCETTTITSTESAPTEVTTTHSIRYKTRRRSKSRFRLNDESTPTSPTTMTPPPTALFATPTPEETTTIPATSAPPPTIGVQVHTHDHRFRPPPTARTPTINEQIVDAIKHKVEDNPSLLEPGKRIEFNINAYTANLAYHAKTTPLSLLPLHGNEREEVEEAPLTNGAQRELLLPTTPISRSTAIVVRQQDKHRKYTFNCFDKPVNRFYSDPRDCRLFHYCTRGFTRSQYLDMKFVCDLGTFFNDEQLVCAKAKPARCA